MRWEKKPFKKGRLYDHDTKYFFSIADNSKLDDEYSRTIRDLSIQFSELLEIPDPSVVEVFVVSNCTDHRECRAYNGFSREDWKDLILHSTRDYNWMNDLLFCYSSRYLVHERENKILRYESLAKTNAVLKFLAQFKAEYTTESFKFSDYYFWNAHSDSFPDFLHMLYEYCCLRMCPNPTCYEGVLQLRIRFAVVYDYLTKNPCFVPLINHDDFLGYFPCPLSVRYRNLARRGVLGHLPFLCLTSGDKPLLMSDYILRQCRRDLFQLFHDQDWRELPIITVEQCCRVARFFVSEHDQFVQEICPFLIEIGLVAEMCTNENVGTHVRTLFNVIYTESCITLERLCQTKYAFPYQCL